LEHEGFIYGMWRRMTFGQYLKDFTEFVWSQYVFFGLVFFAYAVILFVGRYGTVKYIPQRFERLVMEKSMELTQRDPKMSKDKLVRLIYESWKEDVKELPAYVYIKSRRDFWIEKPNVTIIEERLNITKEKVEEMLIKNGVIVDEQQ